MALTSSELVILAAELTNDPLGRGYGAMSDQQVVDDLKTAYRTRIRHRMDSSEVFQAIDLAEFNALTDARQRNVMAMLAFGELNPQGREADLFVNYFGGGSATITALQAARIESISRAVELAIPNVYAPDVAAARA